MVRIGLNNMVLRQTADSKYSHYSGSFTDLVELVAENFEKGTPGYRDGIMLVPVPAEGFFSGVVQVTADTPLKAEFSARRKGEDPYVQVVALGGEKLPARVVEIVCYRHDVLAADGDNSTEAEWEIISINARTTEGPEPLTPMAMARNFLGMPGGTKAEYTAQQFAEAIWHYRDKVMHG